MIHPMHHGSVGLRSVALYEAAKGALALMAATGLFWQRESTALVHRLADHLHLDPARHHHLVLVDALRTDAAAHIRLLAAGALLYAALRFAEAGGLWLERRWAFWLGSLSAAIYLPFELLATFRRPDLLNAALLATTVAVVWYLTRQLVDPPTG